MIRELLSKIFRRRLGKGKLALSGVAFVVGLVLVLLSLHTYLQLKAAFDPKEDAAEYLILSKKVSMLTTATMSREEISQSEYDDLADQPFVKQIGAFQTAKTPIQLTAGEPFRLRLDFLPVESVPESFLDEHPRGWEWEEGDEVPLLVAKDFLNLYNFGVAPSAGLPQVSKGTLRLAPLRVKVKGPKGERTFPAKIVGVTERIPAVLAPPAFLTWANEEIGGITEPQAITRVIVQVYNPSDPAIRDYLDDAGLETKKDSEKQGKAASVLTVLMGILLAIGLGFIALSLVIVVTNVALLIASARGEVELLFQLGYTPRHLMGYLGRVLFGFLGVVAVVSGGLFWWLSGLATGYFQEAALEVPSGVSLYVWLALVGFIGVAVLVVWRGLSRAVRSAL